MSRLRTFLNISNSLSYTHTHTHTFIYIFLSPSLSLSLSLIHRSCLFNGYKILSPSSLRISIYSIPLSFYSLLISLLLPLGIHSALSFLMSFFSSNILKYVFPLSFSFISFNNDFFSLSLLHSLFFSVSSFSYSYHKCSQTKWRQNKNTPKSVWLLVPSFYDKDVRARKKSLPISIKKSFIYYACLKMPERNTNDRFSFDSDIKLTEIVPHLLTPLAL